MSPKPTQYYKEQFGTPSKHAYYYLKSLEEVETVRGTSGTQSIDDVLHIMQMVGVAAKAGMNAELTRAALTIRPELHRTAMEALGAIDNGEAPVTSMADVSFGDNLNTFNNVISEGEPFTVHIDPYRAIRHVQLRREGLTPNRTLNQYNQVETPTGRVDEEVFQFEDHFDENHILEAAVSLWNRQRQQVDVELGAPITDDLIDQIYAAYGHLGTDLHVNTYDARMQRGTWANAELIQKTVLSRDIDADYIKAGLADREKYKQKVAANAVFTAYTAVPQWSPEDIVDLARRTEARLAEEETPLRAQNGVLHRTISRARLEGIERFEGQLRCIVDEARWEWFHVGAPFRTYTTN